MFEEDTFLLVEDEVEEGGAADDTAEELVPSEKKNKDQVSNGSRDQEVGLDDYAGG